jgi:RND superfamily putative drug exporter
MAKLLQRLGLASAKRAWLVVIVWAVVLVGVATAFLTVGGSLATTFAIPGTPAQQVADQLQKSLPSADHATGQVVFSTTDGSRFTASQKSGIASALKTANAAPGIKTTINPFSSEASRAAQQSKLKDAESQLAAASAQPGADQTALAAAAAQLKDSETLLKAASGIQSVSTAGSTAVATVVFDRSNANVTPDDKASAVDAITKKSISGVDVNFSTDLTVLTIGVSPSEIIGFVIAGIVLFIMLGSLVAAGLPLLGSLVGVGVGALGVLSFSGLVQESTSTVSLGLMLGLAVGIDYSLFILNRHRRQLKEGIPLRPSIGIANGTSGNAVLFAGSTVVVALAALNVTGIGFLGLMGTAGAVGVAVAVLVALTFTPAMLSLVGNRVLSKKERAALANPGVVTSARARREPAREGTVATRHPVLILIAGIIVLLIVAVPALSMRLGLPDGKSDPIGSTEYKAYTQIDKAFGAGMNGAIIAVASLPKAADAAAVTHLEAQVAQRLLDVKNVHAAAPGAISSNGRTVVFQVIPTTGPSTASTEQVVRDLRALSPKLNTALNVTLGVTGLTAINIDVAKKLADALPVYLIIVLGLSILLMILVFRSIAVPLIATAGFLLTVLATLGAVVAVYQWGWLGFIFGVHDPGPILSFLPTLLIGIVFGLAMDYQLFLTSGMREAHVHGSAARKAVIIGLRTARPVVTAAGIIMISVFSSFIFGDIVEARVIGFGLAAGVLFDAFIVRLLLVPAAMTLIGEGAWWLPRWVNRILPDVDVEGAKLERPATPVDEPRTLVPAG